MRRSIDITAEANIRKQGLVSICDDVLLQVLPEAEKTNEREWATIFFLYLMWWEGTSGTARTQNQGGVGRGLIQMEPGTMWDIYDHYSRVLSSEKKKDFLAKCAWALSETSDNVSTALEAFWITNQPSAAGKKPKNTWPPATGAAAPVEGWVKEVDSLAIMLMYLHLTRGTEKKIPPKDAANLIHNGRGDTYKEEHAEAWAKHWKKLFPSDVVRKEEKDKFIARAKEVDKL
jgi:hypothetical protein